MVVGAVLTGDGRPICCELWLSISSAQQITTERSRRRKD
jgi:hypothetical protein